MIRYLLPALESHLHEAWRAEPMLYNRSGGRWLLVTGAVAGLGALVLWLGGGPHAGFVTLNHHMGRLPPGLWTLLTSLGDGLVLAMAGLLVAWRWPHLFWAMFLGLLTTLLLTHVPKELLDMPRPAALLAPEDFNLLGPGHRSKALPSGHTLAVFALAGIVIYVLRSTALRAGVLLLAVLCAASRIAVGEHWPLDVLAGAAGGVLAAWLAIVLARHVPGGRNVWVHLALLMLFVTAALHLLVYAPPYAYARPLNISVAVCALAVAGRDYLLVWPRRAQRLAQRG